MFLGLFGLALWVNILRMYDEKRAEGLLSDMRASRHRLTLFIARLRTNGSGPSVTKTCLYNFDPFKPHFYIVKQGFTGVYIIFLTSFCSKPSIVGTR